MIVPPARRIPRHPAAAAGLAIVLTGCALPSQQVQPGRHLQPPPPAPVTPPPAMVEPVLPLPAAPSVKRVPRYSVSVFDVDVRDLLYALARDARIDLDLHPDVQGRITLHAQDQPLAEIMDRVAHQLDVRYDLEGTRLRVRPDTPYLKHYRVDYLNMQRSFANSMAAVGGVGGSGAGSSGGTGGGSGGSGSGSSAGSSVRIDSTAQNVFWSRLIGNVQALISDAPVSSPSASGAAGPGGSAAAGGNPAPGSGSAGGGSAGAGAPAGQPAGGGGASSGGGSSSAAPPASGRYVVAQPEAGVLSVMASDRQHRRVAEFLQQVTQAVARQVLIEATVVEVELSNEYQQGINWQVLRNNAPYLNLGPSGASSALLGGTPASGIIPSMFSFRPSTRWNNGKYDISAVVRLLESFGTTRVLSSPTLVAINQQPALLKVTEDVVYFRLEIQESTSGTGGGGGTSSTRVTSTPTTVSVGLTMTVLPAIGAEQDITLVLRPSLTRITGFVEDPAVAVAIAQLGSSSPLSNIRSLVPQIQVREMESVLRVQSGDIAVLGGLMRDDNAAGLDQVPGLGNVEGLGELFKYRQRKNRKSELVVFLRPTIVASNNVQRPEFARLPPLLNDAYAPLGDLQGQATVPPWLGERPQRGEGAAQPVGGQP